MLNPDNIEACAREIIVAQDDGTQITPFTQRIPAFDLTAGYAIGERIHRLRVAAGDRPAGRKIGMTNRGRWPELGVSAPIWSWLRESSVTQFPDGQGRLDLSRFCQPKIEPEVVVHFRAAPPADCGVAEMLAAIDWVAPAFEIVQTHYASGYGKPADSLADCAHHAALLVGPRVPVDQLGSDVVARMARLSVSLFGNDALRETGTAENVLDSPLAALCAANAVMAAHGARLVAGELVTTGTITTPCPVAVGESWRVEFAGLALPALSVRFE